jgi:hypothetical protein
MTTNLTLSLLVLLGSAAVAAPVVGTKVGDRVPQFTATLVNVSGAEPKKTDFDSHATPRATAYVFVGTTCPATKDYLERMRDLEKTYGGKKVDFVFIYPNRPDTSDAKLAFHKDAKLTSPMVDDQGAKLALALGAKRTSEVVLTDKGGVILFRGGIDDNRSATNVTQRYLVTAIDEHLAGKPVTTTTAQVLA